MEIRFVSSLNDEDEEALAGLLAVALGAFLDETTLHYAVRIETSSRRVYQRESRQPSPDHGASEKPRNRPFLIRS